MRSTSKVALITGGVAGMGLAVAKALVREGWVVTLADRDEKQAEIAIESLGARAEFIRMDVTEYLQQLEAFQKTFEKHGRLDFVFANAGIAGKADFYNMPESWPPNPPSFAVEEVCLRGVINTSYLAMQYMRRNEPPGGVIVMTASAASIYASPELPLYAAAKHGVLGLMRSMSLPLRQENIRVNAILPGAIHTTLHSESIWDQFDIRDFTPIEEVVSTVMDLVKDSQATGKALEISAGEVVDRKQHEFSNTTMEKVMQGKSY
ncbi:hypothetical protein G7046_g4884 [Stylonectria norvegica]|nr:hypothetical protein G7046_g4884 [Stylonectria norvegica]